MLIAIQDNAYKINPDQISDVEMFFEDDAISSIEVTMASGNSFTIEDFDEIRMILNYHAQ